VLLDVDGISDFNGLHSRKHIEADCALPPAIPSHPSFLRVFALAAVSMPQFVTKKSPGAIFQSWQRVDSSKRGEDSTAAYIMVAPK
jgi:hypothetical protein